ncbi:hypothetical protein FHX36_001535 [Modestobacter versicolor]|uniref:Uncharacterized protein n=1 Tax=Modestobacter versicolor TaxID=429133 RepID=A0A839XW14_9ACTN|nr:anthrone oxygenase family protein [Modestobacter versicolor]MBB3675800.1 hypothetical protein [Modestobacter versicolor]
MGTTTRRVCRLHDVLTAVLVALLVADPLRRRRLRADWAHWLPAQQRRDRVMRRLAPPVLLGAIGSGAVAAVLSLLAGRPVAGAGRAAAAVADVAAVRVTRAVNAPVNHELRSWQVEQEAVDWQTQRARWEGGHEIRRVLLGAGAVATAAAARAGR